MGFVVGNAADQLDLIVQPVTKIVDAMPFRMAGNQSRNFLKEAWIRHLRNFGNRYRLVIFYLCVFHLSITCMLFNPFGVAIFCALFPVGYHPRLFRLNPFRVRIRCYAKYLFKSLGNDKFSVSIIFL
jgi:hypothetical protein